MELQHGNRTRAAARALDAATEAFVAFLNRLPEAETIQPLVGGWTPAGHAAHVALTNEVFIGALTGGPGSVITPFAATSDYSDSAWNMEAPPPATAPPILLPPVEIHRAAAVTRLRASVGPLMQNIESMNPETALYCVRLPWGVVSVYQMAEWAAGHTIRHLSQINREMHLGALRRSHIF